MTTADHPVRPTADHPMWHDIGLQQECSAPLGP